MPPQLFVTILNYLIQQWRGGDELEHQIYILCSLKNMEKCNELATNWSQLFAIVGLK